MAKFSPGYRALIVQELKQISLLLILLLLLLLAFVNNLFARLQEMTTGDR
jgi:hypothetical protein